MLGGMANEEEGLCYCSELLRSQTGVLLGCEIGAIHIACNVDLYLPHPFPTLDILLNVDEVSVSYKPYKLLQFFLALSNHIFTHSGARN
jgi:hypothetical protein